jgi:hypothetical protein
MFIMIGDGLFIDMGRTEFSEANGHMFEMGKIIAPNGTQVIPRE